MKLEGKNGLGKILQIDLWISMCIGGITLLFLPLIIHTLHKHFDLFVIIIYPCGALFLIMIYYFIGLFKSIENNNSFDNKNVIRMKKSMPISFIISLLVVIDLLISIFVYVNVNAKIFKLL